jgi:hypothetical protein
MHNHPPGASWLIAGVVLVVLAIVHGWAVLRLAEARPGELAWTLKPRTYWLLLLAVVNPLMPLTALIVVAFAIKSVSDGGSLHAAKDSAPD